MNFCGIQVQHGLSFIVLFLSSLFPWHSLSISPPFSALSLYLSDHHIPSFIFLSMPPILSFHSVCPIPSLSNSSTVVRMFRCVPLTCCVTCRCVSLRHQGSASGSLSRAEGITLTFRAGRRPSSYLMCWREAQPRACCSKTHLLPSLLRMPVQVHFNSWIWFEFGEFDKIEWNVNVTFKRFVFF